MDTDIVIPLGKGSKERNMELKFCLRSIEKYLKKYGGVFVIGEKPPFLNDKITHIPFDEDPRNRYRDRNIMLKMLEACKDSRVSDDFLMVHDDHFLLADYEAGAFPYYHLGPMNEGQGQYGETKQNTKSLLCREIHDTINNFDCHCPIVFNKHKFKYTLPHVGWDRPYGYCLKTLYCVMNGIAGEYTTDIKIRMPLKVDGIKEQIAGRKWFSIGDRCFEPGGMMQVLNELYPKPSKYETN